MIYLVTGSAGFIGFHLSQKLLQENHQVIGVDNLNNYYDPKLKKARLLIRETDQSITSISQDMGFSTVYYFSNLFKKEYKMSPIEYRRSIT